MIVVTQGTMSTRCTIFFPLHCEPYLRKNGGQAKAGKALEEHFPGFLFVSTLVYQETDLRRLLH